MTNWKNKGYWINLTLGDRVLIQKYYNSIPRMGVFIKVTPKGFNILDINSHRTIFKSHLYMKGMAGKKYPHRGIINGDFFIPSYLRIKKVEQKILKGDNYDTI